MERGKVTYVNEYEIKLQQMIEQSKTPYNQEEIKEIAEKEEELGSVENWLL